MAIKTNIKSNIGIKGQITIIKHDYATGQKISENVYNNVTCTVARTEIMKALANNSPVATYLEYCAVGTGAGVPAVSDTILFTELTRKVFALVNQASNVITIRTFFTTSEGNGTLTEIGYFMDDATAALNSGTMFDHATISETKTSSMTLTAILTLTISDA